MTRDLDRVGQCEGQLSIPSSLQDSPQLSDQPFGSNLQLLILRLSDILRDNLLASLRVCYDQSHFPGR